MQRKPTQTPPPTQAPSVGGQTPLPPEQRSLSGSEQPQAASAGASSLSLNKNPRKGLWLGVVIGVLALLVAITMIVGYVWYKNQLSSPAPQSEEVVRLSVATGDTGSSVAAELAEKGVIKSEFAFKVYYRLHRTTGLKVGTYNIERKQSVAEIVTQLEEGKPDEFTLTFIPGGTVSDAKEVLLEAGYSANEIDEAMVAQYDHPLLQDKPADVDLEGYIYGDTYSFFANSSVQDILRRIFDHMHDDIEANNLRQAYEDMGMTLYEGVIFASIVQSEVPDKEDMPIVSQVFHKRLAIDMQLGSDVTFIYGARKLGVPPSVDLDSPYNTRTVKGLTPTPVSNPGLDALIAGAQPSDTDYLYFVAGDDGVTRYSATLEEHERLTREYCMQNCILPPQ